MPTAILVPADELEKLRADAARYRWLRNRSCQWQVSSLTKLFPVHGDEIDSEKLDSTIDRYMSSEPDDDPDYRRQDRRSRSEYGAEELLDNIARAKDQNKGY